MKAIRVMSTTAFIVLLGFTASASARQEKQNEKARPAQHQQQAKPQSQQSAQAPKQQQQHQQAQAPRQQQQRQQQPAKGQQQQQRQQQQARGQQDQQRQQEQAKGQQQKQQRQQQQARGQQDQQRQQQQAKGQQQQQQRQQQQARGQQQQQQRQQQANRSAQQRSPAQVQVQQAAWRGERAHNWQSEHRNWQQRGGYHGYHVPDARFRSYYGQSHGFRIYSLPVMYVGGHRRFHYGGYWFGLVDPWPEYWSNDWYDSDDVYVDYYDGGYYLYNRAYPSDRIAISFYLN
jgi:hypothetical protein